MHSHSNVGGAGGKLNIALPGAVLRSAAITLMGSGVVSISRKGLVQAVADIFDVMGPAQLKIVTRIEPLTNVESVWEKASGKPRVVFTVD